MWARERSNTIKQANSIGDQLFKLEKAPFPPFSHHRQDNMFLIRLEDIAPLLNATFLLNQISDDANLKISPSLFSIIASHRSPRFVAVLKIIPHRFFASYSVDRDHSSRISLHAFYSAMLDGTSCPSMTIHLLENRLILRFENSG